MREDMRITVVYLRWEQGEWSSHVAPAPRRLAVAALYKYLYAYLGPVACTVINHTRHPASTDGSIHSVFIAVQWKQSITRVGNRPRHACTPKTKILTASLKTAYKPHQHRNLVHANGNATSTVPWKWLQSRPKVGVSSLIDAPHRRQSGSSEGEGH